jgi:D-threo-aldose 1-dehydrogenase
VTRPAIPRFGLGCAQLGNLFHARTDEEMRATLEAAWEAGVRHFDTAPHYGLGLSEKRLGAFLAGKPRDEFVLSTKAGRLLRANPRWQGERDEQGFDVPADLHRVWDFSESGIRASLEESLERLGLGRVDVLYLHDPEHSGVDGAVASGMSALTGLRDEGLVTYVGAGSMAPATLLAAARLGADLLMAANCYTLVNQGVAEAGVLDACTATGTRIVAAAVFNSGLLASSPQPGAMYDYAEVPADVLDRARRIDRVCAAHGVVLPTAAMQFPLLDSRVAAVVVGSGRPEQVLQNLDRLNVSVPDALWDDLDAQGLVPRCA